MAPAISSTVARPALVIAPVAQPRRWAAVRTLPSWVLALLGVLLATSAVFSAQAADSDSGYDLVALLRVIGTDLVGLRWQFAALVLLLALLHYAATALATQAASGLPLPFGETVLVQLAAAAANRVSAAGVGGAAVNARYFNRRGLSVPSAVGAVAALGVLGAVADLLVLALLVAAGRWIGLTGVSYEVGALSSKLAGLAAPLWSWWTWLFLAGLAAAAVITRSRWTSRLAKARNKFWQPVAGLLHRPRRLALLLTASAATTLILAFAFLACVQMVPGSTASAGSGALLVGFMFGAAAGNAVPTPAGIGATETALIAVLVATGIPAAHAAETVIIYRLLTFWGPPLLGLVAARRLYRNGAL